LPWREKLQGLLTLVVVSARARRQLLSTDW